MQFQNLSEDAWRLFFSWAELAGWRISFQECRLFQNQWRPYFFALYAAGEVQGFVSAVAYKKSGWIGNLLVRPERRGLGYGAALFDFALDFLRRAKLQRIWLTASDAGQPIYRRRGFVAVDRIERWIARGIEKPVPSSEQPVAALIDLDSRCWGESRAPLLNALADDGELVCDGEAMALLQPGVNMWQLGPWLSAARKPQQNRNLLNLAVEKTALGKELLCDVLASAEMELVLRACGFKKSGSSQLMVLSEEPVTLAGVIALASLGSIG